MNTHIYENLFPAKKTNIPEIVKALDGLSEHLKKLSDGEVVLETEYHVNFRSGEVEVRSGGRNGSSGWSLSYRCKNPEIAIRSSAQQRNEPSSANEVQSLLGDDMPVAAFGYENIPKSEVRKQREVENAQHRYCGQDNKSDYVSSDRESLFDAAMLDQSHRKKSITSNRRRHSSNTSSGNNSEQAVSPSKKHDDEDNWSSQSLCGDEEHRYGRCAYRHLNSTSTMGTQKNYGNYAARK